MLNDDFNTPTPTRPDGFRYARNVVGDMFKKMLNTTVLNEYGATDTAATKDLHRFATRALNRLPHLTTRNELEELHQEGITRLQTHQNLAA